MTDKFQKSVELSYALYDEVENGHRCKHFSLVFYKDRVITIATNNKKTSPWNLRNPKINRQGIDISHLKGSCSELRATLQLKRKTNIPYNKCVLVNVRINKNRKIDISKPCTGCLNLLKFINYKSVFYTNKNGQFEEFLLDN